VSTFPNYSLTTRVEGTCRTVSDSGASSADAAVPTAGRGIKEDDSSHGGVLVEATGVVGAFEWTVISLDPSLPEPADVAVKWLTDNDVPSSAQALLGAPT
jgi:hypothetical protein